MSLIQDYPNLINVAAVVLGWIVINLQNNKREKRKEIRAMLNDAQEMLATIEADSLFFHTNLYDAKQRSLITFKTGLMSQKIGIITNELNVERSDEINAFRNSIMGSNWDHDAFRALDSDCEQLKAISLHSSNLSIALEKDFILKYHCTLPKRLKNFWKSKARKK